MVKASVFPGTPRAGYGPRRATLQEDRPGAYRDRRTLPTRELQASRHLYCACAAPTKGPALPDIIDRHRPAPGGQGPHARGSCRPRSQGAETRRIHAARPGNTSGFRSDAPLRDPHRAPGKRRRRKRPQTSFSSCIRPAAHPPCPEHPPSPLSAEKFLRHKRFRNILSFEHP